MKLKKLFIVLDILCIAWAAANMLPFSPFSDEKKSLFKSGYFLELEEKCLVAGKGFTAVKTAGKEPASAWVFLKNLESAGLSVSVSDRKGREVPAPGLSGRTVPDIQEYIRTGREGMWSFFTEGRFRTVMPLHKKPECGFCHGAVKDGSCAGYLIIDQDYDAAVYYTRERILVFGGAVLILMILLFFIIRWQPERRILEMFPSGKERKNTGK